jgi:hypothetical protein
LDPRAIPPHQRSEALPTVERYSVPAVKDALDALGVTLSSELEYADIALRLNALVDAILNLMTEIPDASEPRIPHDIPVLPDESR